MSKTGIEILSDLVASINLLNQKLELMDINIKLLMNRVNVLDTAHKPKLPVSQTKMPQVQAVEPSEKKMKIELTKKPGVMVNGKVVISEGDKNIPVYDAIIKVYDAADKMVRETKTNRGGEWRCMLKAGSYIAEITGVFKGKKLVPQNKTFVIPENIKEFEVH